jgi:hypothetical protein
MLTKYLQIPTSKKIRRAFHPTVGLQEIIIRLKLDPAIILPEWSEDLLQVQQQLQRLTPCPLPRVRGVVNRPGTTRPFCCFQGERRRSGQPRALAQQLSGVINGLRPRGSGDGS